MDVGIRGPLVDLFRRGEASSDVRLLAARGGLGAPALEQVALLFLLIDEREIEAVLVAAETIDAIPVPALSAFLARPDVLESVREYFAIGGVVPGSASQESEEPLVDADEPLPAAAGGESGNVDRKAPLSSLAVRPTASSSR